MDKNETCADEFTRISSANAARSYSIHTQLLMNARLDSEEDRREQGGEVVVGLLQLKVVFCCVQLRVEREICALPMRTSCDLLHRIAMARSHAKKCACCDDAQSS